MRTFSHPRPGAPDLEHNPVLAPDSQLPPTGAIGLDLGPGGWDPKCPECWVVVALASPLEGGRDNSSSNGPFGDSKGTGDRVVGFLTLCPC